MLPEFWQRAVRGEATEEAKYEHKTEILIDDEDTEAPPQAKAPEPVPEHSKSNAEAPPQDDGHQHTNI